MSRSQDPLTRLSKFISLILRHHPEAIGIVIDEHEIGRASCRERV